MDGLRLSRDRLTGVEEQTAIAHLGELKLIPEKLSVGKGIMFLGHEI